MIVHGKVTPANLIICRIAPLTSTIYPNLGKHRSPRNGYILGRVGATGNWTVLKNWTNVIHGWEDLVLRDFDIENPSEYYDYFRVVWTAINGNTNYSTSAGAGYASSGEIEFLGLPEYDPEAHGTDVVVKSVPNVPNTDWLEVYYDAKDLVDGSTTVNDLKPVGTAVNGTVVGNTTVSDGAFTFDGSGDYISGTLPSSASGEWVHSTSIWFKTSTYTGTIIFIGNAEVTNERISVVLSTIGQITIGISGSNVRYARATPLDYGWHHLAYTYTGGAAGLNATGYKLYVDGVNIPQTDGVGSGTLNLPTGPNFYVGNGLNGGSPITGSIANFRLFNRVLTSDEIWQLYAYQKEYFGHGDLGMTLKAGRLGIGTSEPRAMLDVRGNMHANGGQSWPIPCAIFSNVTPSNTGSTYYENNIGTTEVNYNKISLEDPSGTIQASVGSPYITLNRVGMYEFHTESSLKLQSGAGSSHIGHAILSAGVSGSGVLFEADGYELITTTYNVHKLVNRTSKVLVTSAPYVVKYRLQPIANFTDRFIELAYGNNNEIHAVAVKYLG